MIPMTQAERDAARERARAESMRRIELLSQLEDIAQFECRRGKNIWTVKIRRVAGEHYQVSGRGSQMILYLQNTLEGILVSVPSHNRCGLVPADCTPENIMDYCDFKNTVDATTLAAAVNYLASTNRI